MPVTGRRFKVAIAATVLTAASWLTSAFSPGSTAHAACRPGSDSCPIRIHFRPGSDRITVRGRLTRHRMQYAYAFKARAGQRLTWTFKGPTVRTVIRSPDGDSDGPGLPHIVPLRSTGTYVFTVSSNTMADDIFGPFRLTFRIR